MSVPAFDENCFVNCPFDPEYQPLLRALLFLLIGCGLRPRLATERSDSGEVRLSKIRTLIEESRYSIHDLSRMEIGELPRFNMPFELGLDLGYRFANIPDKQCLVLEEKKYRYQAVLSDISGQDVRAHKNDVQELMHQVRSWLQPLKEAGVPPKKLAWVRFNEFTDWLEESLKSEGYDADDIERQETPELVRRMRTWFDETGCF